MSKMEKILDSLQANFSESTAEVADVLRQSGLSSEDIESMVSELEWSVGPPESLTRGIPTLERGCYRRPTPQLTARFRFGGTIRYMTDAWLGIREMEDALDNKKIMATFEATREHWTGSAPATVTRDRLSLFSFGAVENQAYLVWPDPEGAEPEVWAYRGHEERKFKDLMEFLTWQAGSQDVG